MRPRLRTLGRLGLRARVTVAFALGSLAITSLFALLTWSVVDRYLVERREAAGLREASSGARLVDDALRRESERLADLVTGLAGEAESTVLVRRADGWLSSGQVVSAADLPADFRSALDGGAAVRQRLHVRGVPVLAVGLPLPAQGAQYVEVTDLRELDDTLRFISTMLFAGTVASAVLGGLVGQWLSRRALQPLTRLTDAAARFASGDLDARLPVSTDPQLGPVAGAFNETAESLKRRAVRDARFAGDVSHELRSPITTMMNALAVLRRRREELPSSAGQAVDLLGIDLARFRRMVDDLLEISQVDAGRADLILEPVDLAELVRNALGPRSPAVQVAVEGSPPRVLADRRRMERVVANLVQNADRHGRGVTRVAVGRRGDWAWLEVDDAGPGVPEADRQRVFERYARGPSGERGLDDTGSGLGLALADQHVLLHGGRMRVEDSATGGARFVVELPVEG